MADKNKPLAYRIKRIHCIYNRQKPIVPVLIDGHWIIPYYVVNNAPMICRRKTIRMIKRSLEVIQPVIRNIYFRQVSSKEEARLVFQFTSNTNIRMQKKFTVNNVALCETNDGIGKVWMNSRFNYRDCSNNIHGAMVRMNIAHQVGHCLGLPHEDIQINKEYYKQSLMNNHIEHGYPVITPFMVECAESFYQQYWVSEKPKEKLDILVKAILKASQTPRGKTIPSEIIHATAEVFELPSRRRNFEFDWINYPATHQLKIIRKIADEMEKRGLNEIDFM